MPEHKTYTENIKFLAALYRVFYICGLADLLYNVPSWLYKISNYAPNATTTIIVLGLVYLLLYTVGGDSIRDDPIERRAATVEASRRLMSAMSAEDKKRFKASLTAFEDSLIEDASDVIRKIWSACRGLVRVVVICRMFLLGIWFLCRSLMLMACALVLTGLVLSLVVSRFQSSQWDLELVGRIRDIRCIV